MSRRDDLHIAFVELLGIVTSAEVLDAGAPRRSQML